MEEKYIHQIASDGKILTNGVMFSYEVYTPIGFEWSEVDDEGQLDEDFATENEIEK